MVSGFKRRYVLSPASAKHRKRTAKVSYTADSYPLYTPNQHGMHEGMHVVYQCNKWCRKARLA